MRYSWKPSRQMSLLDMVPFPVPMKLSTRLDHSPNRDVDTDDSMLLRAELSSAADSCWTVA